MENTNQKEDILKEVSSIEQNKKNINWGSGIITGVLVLLVLISFAQIAQSGSILKKIKSGDLKAGTGTSQDNSIPSNLQNLPNMVGGC